MTAAAWGRLRDSAPPMLAVNWDDLYPPFGNGIWYYNDSANHRFVVQWDSMPYVQAYTTVDWFELVLYDTTLSAPDGNCEFLFQYLTANKTNSATIGIQDPTDSVGITELFNATYTKGASPWVPGHVVKFTTDVPKVAVKEPATVTALPQRLGLLTSAPNPFRDATRLRYTVPREMKLSLSVYDRTGRRVKRLFSGVVQPGVRTAMWNGRDELGRSVAQGIYFWRLESETTSLTRKAIKIE